MVIEGEPGAEFQGLEQVVRGLESCGGHGDLFRSGRGALCGRSGDKLFGPGLCGLGG